MGVAQGSPTKRKEDAVNNKQRNDKVWAKVGQDRRQLEALKEAAKAFLAGNTTAEAVAQFTAALDDNNFKNA